MIFILQILLLAFGLFLDNAYAKFIPLSLPIVYIFIVSPGAFMGTRNINGNMLKSALSKNWMNADELAQYIQKYWVGLEYIYSSRSRQNNCFTLSLASFGLSFWYYLSDHTLQLLTVLMCGTGFLCGIVLYITATRVNRPQSIFHDQGMRLRLSDPIVRDEWDMAAISMVAFAELFPDSKAHNYQSRAVLSDDIAKYAVKFTESTSSSPSSRASITSMKCNGIKGLETSFILDSTALHRGYLLRLCTFLVKRSAKAVP